MKATTTKGKEIELRVGANVCGFSFTSITFEPEDIKDIGHPKFCEWFFNMVVPRLFLTTTTDGESCGVVRSSVSENAERGTK